MTYYGRWTYNTKPRTKGAAAAYHPRNEPALIRGGRQSSWARRISSSIIRNKNMDAVSRAYGSRLMCQNYSPIAARISTPSKNRNLERFRPCAECKRQHRHQTSARSFRSHNVIGQARGRDSTLKDEFTLQRHWIISAVIRIAGDQFSTAVDNA